MPVAAAIIGSTVVGAAASKSAADKQAKGVKQSIASTNALAAQARQDAINLYGTGRQSARNAQQGVMDFYKSTNQAPSNAYIQANMLGQKAIGQGYQQANNALLGLPVDMSFAQNPQSIQGDYSAINAAQLPQQLGNPLAAPPVSMTMGANPNAPLDEAGSRLYYAQLGAAK